MEVFDMKILNCYAGIGGNRKMWGDNHEITAIEINPQVAEVYKSYFPNDKVIVTDAHDYLLEYFQEFDFIWLSPPCQTHSAMARVNAKRYVLIKYIDAKLWQEIILLQEYFNGLYVVENVKPYYKPLIEPNYKLNRHYFWSNFKILPHKKQNVENFIDSKFDDLKKWLGYNDFNERIYLNGNHDYTQILRNCVHPDTGKHILDCAINKNKDLQVKQIGLFEQLNKYL